MIWNIIKCHNYALRLKTWSKLAILTEIWAKFAVLADCTLRPNELASIKHSRMVTSGAYALEHVLQQWAGHVKLAFNKRDRKPVESCAHSTRVDSSFVVSTQAQKALSIYENVRQKQENLKRKIESMVWCTEQYEYTVVRVPQSPEQSGGEPSKASSVRHPGGDSSRVLETHQ